MKKSVCFSILLYLLIALTSICFAQTTVYDHKVEVKGMSFHWKVEGGNLNVKLIGTTTGWVGVGFNPTEAMKDANFILGYVKDGKAKVTDHFGNTLRQHQSDKKLGGQKNITNIAGKEENGATEISFTIPMKSGDPKDQPLSLEKDTTVLLAYGAGRDSFKSKHLFKASMKVNLKTGKVTK